MTFVSRLTDFHITHTGIFQYLFNLFFVLVAYLDHDTRILGKQNFHKVVFLHFVEVDLHTTFYISETHFKQSCNQTTGRNIMSGKNQSFVYQFLNSKESIAEIFGILYGRYNDCAKAEPPSFNVSKLKSI